MGFFNWVSGKVIDEFVNNLAEDLLKKYPPDIQDSGRKISEKRLTKILEETFTRAKDFKNEHQLGWYKRAKLGNSFRWKLKELGYGDDFIEMAVEGMVVYITGK